MISCFKKKREDEFGLWIFCLEEQDTIEVW